VHDKPFCSIDASIVSVISYSLRKSKKFQVSSPTWLWLLRYYRRTLFHKSFSPPLCVWFCFWEGTAPWISEDSICCHSAPPCRPELSDKSERNEENYFSANQSGRRIFCIIKNWQHELRGRICNERHLSGSLDWTFIRSKFPFYSKWVASFVYIQTQGPRRSSCISLSLKPGNSMERDLRPLLA
jgi:hypothetical protein